MRTLVCSGMQFLEPDKAPEDEREEDELREDIAELRPLPVDVAPSPQASARPHPAPPGQAPAQNTSSAGSLTTSSSTMGSSPLPPASSPHSPSTPLEPLGELRPRTHAAATDKRACHRRVERRAVLRELGRDEFGGKSSPWATPMWSRQRSCLLVYIADDRPLPRQPPALASPVNYRRPLDPVPPSSGSAQHHAMAPDGDLLCGRRTPESRRRWCGGAMAPPQLDPCCPGSAPPSPTSSAPDAPTPWRAQPHRLPSLFPILHRRPTTALPGCRRQPRS